jgi:hypothetical protein
MLMALCTFVRGEARSILLEASVFSRDLTPPINKTKFPLQKREQIRPRP